MTTSRPTSPTIELLNRYLPGRDKRTPPDRLKAIAGKALHDGRKKLPPLTDAQAEDAYSHLLETGLRALTEYNPDLDQNPDVALDVRFGRFAYLRMRQRLIDWHRKHIHDPRPGKSDRRTVSLGHAIVSTHRSKRGAGEARNDHDLPDPGPDFTELVASADRIERWNAAATLLGFDVTTWILATLDQRATDTLDNEAA